MPSHRIKYEMIVAIAAICIGVFTLFVYIYQSRIMREQQHAAVWPYLEWTLSLSTIEGMGIDVVNKGVGPALIKSVSLKIDDRSVNSLQFIQKITGKTDSLSYYIVDIDSTVVAPGEQIHFIRIADCPEIRKLDPGVYSRISLQICFCSIYGDCWTSSGKKVIESQCQ